MFWGVDFGMGVAMRCSRNVETVLWSIRERVGVIRKKRLCADKSVHSYLPYTDVEDHVLTGLRDTIRCGCPSAGVWCLRNPVGCDCVQIVINRNRQSCYKRAPT